MTNQKPISVLRWVFWLHLFFSFRALGAADGFHFFHSPLHRRLREKGALLELLQDARPLVFFLETFECTVDRFIFVKDNSYQRQSPPQFLAVVKIFIDYSAARFSISRREPSFSKETRIARPPLDVFSFPVTFPMSSQSE